MRIGSLTNLKMATKSKSSKSSGTKKPQVKMADLKPRKDAKGGVTRTNKGKFNQN